MNYCFECGTQLTRSIPCDDDVERQSCPNCGWIHYDNPRLLVGVHLYHKNKMFWIKRGTEPNKGLWTFPGGFLEQGESLQLAASRELFEETRIQIAPEKLIPFGLLSLTTMGQVYLSFRCHCDEPYEATLTEEVADWGWFDEANAPWPELAYSGTIDQVRQTYQCLRDKTFPIRVGEINKNGIIYNNYQSKA